ncbi:MAG: glycosyltransferase family A protein [Elusimicrobiota bacterium]
MNTPLVSVVVNNYNNERYLKECLDALIGQSYKNLEIVVVDAFSRDGSRALLDAYASSDPRIKLVYVDSYIKYPAITYNLGFLSCSGEFIAINDPDDVSMPTRIEKQVRFLLANGKIDVVGCNCIEFNDSLERTVITTVEANVANSASPARNPSLMFRKIVLARHGMWKWQCEYAADFEWLYRWYALGVTFFILPEPLIRYRYEHGGNVSSSRTLNQAAKLAAFRTYFGFRLIGTVGPRWWATTLFSYYRVTTLSLRWLAKRAVSIVRGSK